ncbi:MAG: hypothetical protein K5896_01785 [Prevotella sp.]|nr:hypothetical protein [Prevotella sp.]
MSKTVELQIEKGRTLVEGLRKHLTRGVGGGVTPLEIDRMEQTLVQLKAANAEVERIREELQPKVKNMNSLMAQVKQNYTELKKTIKGYYPQEQWADYGVPDKR